MQDSSAGRQTAFWISAVKHDFWYYGPFNTAPGERRADQRRTRRFRLKIVDVKSLAIPEIKVIRFARFPDHRGYFTEHFRKSDIAALPFMTDVEFRQGNESYSKPGTIRGLHFQWNPYMGKLVRTLSGRMTDLVLDIRKGSPAFGKILAYDMPGGPELEYSEWIWVPKGFAHGNYFSEPTTIEYYCSAEYSPGCEGGISPLSADIDWSLCEPGLKSRFDAIVADSPLMTDKDRNGHTLASWTATTTANLFLYRLSESNSL
jgi:dTDP-4-dehydrorhamnose 3,5-epimerase